MKKTLQVEGPWREALRMFARNPSADSLSTKAELIEY